MYLKYFGFREAPFNLTPDPKFFFDGPLHREAWASLLYGIKEKKGFVVVTGEVGTGKTTLIRKVLRSLEATHHSVFIFNTRLTFDELLETILRDLDLEQSGAGRVAMLEKLNEFLLEKIRAGHTVSIIIDEAQNLTEDVLEGVRLLSNMETDREKLLQIILVGQPELDVKLNARSLRQLKQRVTLWCRLDCLGQKDTESYIQHRLNVAGYEGTGLFDAAALSCIWEETSGIPRLINAVCDSALLTAFATSKKTVSVSIVHESVRDLRIKQDSQRSQVVADGSDFEPPEGKLSGSFGGVREGRIVGKSRRSEDQDGSLFRRQSAVAAADLMPEPVAREPRSDVVARSELREHKRHQMRAVASVAELKEKRNPEKARVIEIAENQWPSRPITANADMFAAPSQKFDDGPDDTLVPAAFFEKLCAALTEAMGPMAPIVIRSEVAALGESMQRFPVDKLWQLTQQIKGEILNGALRAVFEKQVLNEIERNARPSSRRNSAQ